MVLRCHRKILEFPAPQLSTNEQALINQETTMTWIESNYTTQRWKLQDTVKAK